MFLLNVTKFEGWRHGSSGGYLLSKHEALNSTPGTVKNVIKFLHLFLKQYLQTEK
jgi:hypothetical protein